MCTNCFTSEIDSFKSQDDWLAFDLELKKKLSKGNLTATGHKSGQFKDNFDYFFECTHCHQKWRLNDPDNSWRGYLKIVNAK